MRIRGRSMSSSAKITETAFSGDSMNILGINGSPRRKGNTETLLRKVLDGARNKDAVVEEIDLNSLVFSPCQECENLRNDGSCILEDQLQLLYHKTEEADIVIVASPIFFGSVSAQTKMMIDRFQCVWRARYILNRNIYERRKEGVFLAVQASDRQDYFDNARQIIKNFFAVINAAYGEELFCSRVGEKGAVLLRKDILEEAYNLGRKIARER